MKLNLIDIISKTIEENSFAAVFNVPGFGGSEVTDKLSKADKTKTFINLNEEAAFSISYGVSSNGKRSATLIKSQGFTKAMNAITSSLSTEISAANLIFIFDDTEGKSSDNILPTKNLVKSTEIPFEIIGESPSLSISNAIKTSERLKMPVAVIVDCKKLKHEYLDKIQKTKIQKIKTPKFTERLACPVLTKYQREKLKNKLSGSAKKITTPKIDDIRSVLPERLVIEFLKYEKFMNIFKKHRPSFVSGDAGTSALYAFSPFNCVDTCTYMGGGPGMAIGAMIAGFKDAVCITGDFSFLAAGILGFNEAINHNHPLKVILFNNRKAHATGGQELNSELLDSFKRAHKKSITTLALKKTNELDIEKELINFFRKDELAVLILDV